MIEIYYIQKKFKQGNTKYDIYMRSNMEFNSIVLQR